jgi:phosphotriesterase-related protein
MHEHLFVTVPEVHDAYPASWFDEGRLVDEALGKLDAAYRQGVRTIVDMTVLGLGRNVDLMARVAAQTPIHIVCASGVYAHDVLPFYFNTLRRQPDGRVELGNALEPGQRDTLLEFILWEIREGLAGSGIKPAVLKCVTDVKGLTPGVERAVRAVARAHVASGLPISTHTDGHTRRGLDQQRIFHEEGVDLGRVVIGHSGDVADYDYLEELLAAGSYLGMDRFGFESKGLSLGERADIVAELVRRGYSNRLVLSHDTACAFHMAAWDEFAAANPNWVFTHLFQEVLPALRDRGVSDDQLRLMLVDNPRAILGSGQAASSAQ